MMLSVKDKKTNINEGAMSERVVKREEVLLELYGNTGDEFQDALEDLVRRVIPDGGFIYKERFTGKEIADLRKAKARVAHIQRSSQTKPSTQELTAEPTAFWEYENRRLVEKWEGIIREIRSEFLGTEEPLNREEAEAWLRGNEDKDACVIELIVPHEHFEELMIKRHEGRAATLKRYSFVPNAQLSHQHFGPLRFPRRNSPNEHRIYDGASHKTMYLHYYDPQGKPRHVRCGSFLARLFAECEYLSEHIGWVLIDVVDWVLCGKKPKSSLLRIRSDISYADRPYPPTFVMRGDLRATTREVARLYQRAKEGLDEEFEDVRRYYYHVRKELHVEETAGEENLAFSYPSGKARRTGLLLSFVDETQHLSWEKRLEEWNARYPEYSYKNKGSMRAAYCAKREKAPIAKGEHKS
jgi:hypothetical protein